MAEEPRKKIPLHERNLTPEQMRKLIQNIRALYQKRQKKLLDKKTK